RVAGSPCDCRALSARARRGRDRDRRRDDSYAGAQLRVGEARVRVRARRHMPERVRAARGVARRGAQHRERKLRSRRRRDVHVFESGNYDVILLRFAVRNVAKYSPPIAKPKGDTRDDWDILSDLAMRIAGPDVRWMERAWRRMARTLPELAIDLLLRTGPTDL